jgi:sterol desaturase/sphingolipid hydroxylase (fatty acid hydroxylase superfamily)
VPLLGLQLSELAAYETLLAASTAFHHANVSLGKWDAVLRVLFVTPDIHKLHHSIDPRQTHSNFSTILSVWDRLAGTFQRPVHPETIEFGVADLKDTSSQGFVGIWTTPFRRPRTVSSDTPAPSQALKSTHNAGEISGSHRP